MIINKRSEHFKGGRTIRKYIFITNGMARCGKDSFAAFMNEIIPTLKYSSIDEIKRIAKECGWDGKKDEKSRRFLSDLKILTSEYNELPFTAIARKVDEFKNDHLHQVMLIDIREPDEIEKAKNAFGATTILIRSNRVKNITSNIADANVFNYKYDFEIENNGTLDEFRDKVIEFVENIIEEDS